MSFSALVLTLNEERNLPSCLASLSRCDDIVVFDSMSSDRTVEIAREAGARVFQNRFIDYGQQREDARTKVDYRHAWVLTVDADERPEPALLDEIQALLERGEPPHAAYRLRRKDHFMGQWIKNATLYPSWFLRFFRNDSVSYPRRAVHEYPDVQGTIGALEGHLLHYSFNKGLSDWLEKHNRYSELEAAEALRELAERPIDWSRLLELCDPVVRRRTFKSISYRLPLRPALRFAYMYLLRRGFLDGIPGLTYCTLLGFYEYLIVLKMEEIRARQAGREF